MNLFEILSNYETPLTMEWVIRVLTYSRFTGKSKENNIVISDRRLISVLLVNRMFINKGIYI